MINIILAEDHNIVRNGLKSLLEKEIDFNMVGEASNGNEVLELLASGVHADVILTDMNMPGMGGVELTTQIKALYPHTKCIILSALDHEKYVIKAFHSSADGYLLKNVSADELIFAIRHVYSNQQYICSELTTKFLNRILTMPEPVNTDTIHDIDFTNRETEILGLIADGYTNQEIADKIYTSKRTVEGHRQSLIDKTGARNTAALVKFAIVNGIIG
jgi:DNA-binding NarL/FixJ family response regulator